MTYMTASTHIPAPSSVIVLCAWLFAVFACKALRLSASCALLASVPGTQD